MPSLKGFRTYVFNGPKPSPAQRLERWIKKHAVPPAHVTVRPLQYSLPKKIVLANGYATSIVWLTCCGELRLAAPSGPVIGKIAITL